MVCNDRVFVSLDEFCNLSDLDAGIFAEGENNADFFSYALFDNNDDPIDLENPNAPNHISNYVGECLVYKLTDICTGNLCWGEICIEDKVL